MVRVSQEENGHKGRFVIHADDHFAGEMAYTWAGTDKFIIDHTDVNPEYSGKGFGKQMLEQAVAYARDHEVKILPLCPFAKATMLKHAEFQDVLFGNVR